MVIAERRAPKIGRNSLWTACAGSSRLARGSSVKTTGHQRERAGGARRAPGAAWVAVAAGAIVLGCQSAPEPRLRFAASGGPTLDELEISAQLTSSVESSALRRPPLSELVDAQIDAMVAHVRRAGTGELDPGVTSGRGAAGSVEAELARLEEAGARLVPNLALASGPRQLGKVAVEALRTKLGDEAEYQDPVRDPGIRRPEVVPEIQDGIGVLSLRHVDSAGGGRLLGVLSAWAALEPRPRAILLDLADCDIAGAETASALVNAFAPGVTAFDVVFRSEESQKLERRSWRGEPGWGSDAFARSDLFIVVSERTGALAEAVAYALRLHRNARILGAPTPGSGRLTSWERLPWNAWFGFAVADLIAPDGERLRGKPVIPDACLVDGVLVALPAPALRSPRERCGSGMQLS